MKRRNYINFKIKNLNFNWFLFLGILIIIGFSSSSSYAQTVGADCASAPLLTVNTEYTGLTNITDNIVNDPTEAACNTQTIVRDGWVKFVASGTEAIVRANATNRNPILFGYSGACGSLINLGCINANTGTGGHTETLTLTGLTSGNTYYIRIGNSTANNMTLASFIILTNDKCSNAYTLTSNTSCVTTTGSTLGATVDSGTGVCTTGSGTKNAVWYEFQAIVTTHVVTVTGITGQGFDTVLNVISSCGSATIPTGGGCIDATGNNGTETRTLTGLTPGAFYKIQIHDFQGDLTGNAFTICVTHTLPPCTTPTAQPTSLNLTTVSATSISGSFTAATPAPSGYLIVRSSSATAPTLANGTTYAVGSTALTPGTTYVIQGSVVTSNGVTFTDTGLTSNTKYYYYVFSYNNTCVGAPFYYTTTPATNNANTCALAPTVPVNSAITSSGFTVSWTASPAGGSAGTINYILEVYTDAGYTTPIAGSPFAVGTPTTYPLTGLNSGTTYYYRIKANNGTCDTAYLPGSVLTGCVTPSAQPTTLNLTTVSATSISGAFTAATPAPSGYLIVRSSSATAPTLVDGITYAVGSTALTPGTTYVIQGSVITSNAVTFTDTGLTSNTNYYYHIFSYNSNCYGAPFYNNTTPLTNNAVTCPAPPTNALNSAITGSGFTVSWTASPAGGSSGTINYILEVYTDAGYTTPIAGSPFAVGTLTTYPLTGLNAGTTYYYRIKANNGTCDSTYLTNSAVTGCVTPSAQPTILNLTTVSTTSISGAFTAASPAPSGYLIVRSSSATPPTLVDGTTYAIGSTVLTPGTTYVIQGSLVTNNAVTFTDTGLTSNTKYYYHIFSYNSSCTGAPFYNSTSPLTNNADTCPAPPTVAINSAITGAGFTVSWTASAAGGNAATINYTLEVYTNPGFTGPIAGSPFSVGTAITYAVTGLNAATTYYYRIKANNGTCDSTYLTGSAVTGCATPSAQPTTLNLTTVSATSISGAFTAASPAPSGYIIVRSSNATPPTLVNGTTYAVGSTALTPGTTYVIQGSVVTSNAVTFTDTGLTSNTRYYYHIFSYNNSCTGAPFYNNTAPLTNNAVTCPAPSTAAVNSAITSSGFTVSWTATPGGSGATLNYTLEVYTNPAFTGPVAGSPFSVGTPTTYAVTGLNAGTNYYYRIKANNGACDSPYLTGSVLTGCATPSAQPTTLNLTTVSTTSISGAFTAASPAPSGYIIVRSSSATPPTLVNGNTYAVGSTALTPGTTYVIQGSVVTSNAVTFTDTGLASNTRYYYHIFSYNNSCTGAPFYNNTAPLTNNAVTCPAPPTAAVNSAITSSGFTVSWTATPGGSGATLNYTLEVYTNPAFTGPVAGSPFSVGTPTTYAVSGLSAGTNYYYRIRVNNGACNSTYLTGSVLTGCATPSAQPTTLNLTTVSATSISGAFTAASPAPSGYIIVRSSSATPPTLVNGTTYAVGSTVLTPGTTYVVQGSAVTSNAVTFTDTGLTGNTKYYYHIFSYNTGCTGAPFYNNTTPLTNNANTCPNVPNSLTVSGVTTNAFNFNWAVPTGGTTIALTYTVQVTTDAGFTVNVAGSPFTVNSPTVTLYVTGLNPATTYYVRIRAGNGTCNSAYVTGFTITKPINDDCSSATPLTVSTNCSYTASSNNGATNSTGAPAPSCANYSGGDVWFSAVVPANGVLIISSQAGVMTDGGMAAYSGTCGGTLTQIGCDDDSAFEAMPSLTLTSLTPGNTIWIRFWEYGNNNNGTFGICVTTPCDSGTATGTTTLLCTLPIAGGLGLGGADPATVTCVSGSSCVDLEATYPVLKSTTNYDVTSIPYAPPYQFNCLRNPVSVNVDDVWSPVITLPFNFCFYGNSYTQCVMGSNGIISFNTGLANSASGYEYNNNLPSTVGKLFANSIYGVYHDIDPSVGGEVGWELITLNTGCRALVAGWSDVPMYYDKSILYTGMMVLYENSNVIEVYIKEKKIDRYSTYYGDAWNFGNGIVGVQNAAATAAVVAPGRNGLDANWTATNEAWRFTPSGSSIATVKWYQGAGTAGPVVGTTPTISVCPSATTTYTAEISYALCNGTLKQTDQTLVTINKDKTWTGFVDSDWDKDANWSPSGKPTAVNCIVIPNVTNDPVISSGSYNAFGHNLTVQTGGFLQINPTSNVTITDAVAVNTGGIFSLKNSASLIQINDSAINTGNITMERLTNIRKTDYVYWSSPVENFSSSAISPGTNPYYLFKWNPSIPNSNNGQGNWVSGNETMVAGKGYIVRGPDSFSSSPANYTATFTGKAQNGIYSPSITRGDITSVAGTYPAAPYAGTNGVTITERNDNWNLLGNPYPSAISALNFLSLNAVTNNRIVGNVRLWTHGTDISPANANAFYATYGYNYSVTDYINYNGTGPAIPGFDGLIGAGQGFFVLMNEAPTPQTSSVTFQNSMRSNAFRNDQFYRQETTHVETPNDLNTINRNRIWVSLVNSSNIANTTLVGYVDGATLGEDILFDAPHFITAASSIYSLTEDKPWIIQGRPTPFDSNDIVPMGVVIPSNDIYHIALSQVDGLFDNTAQGIYLEDTSLAIIHDLRASPYSFTAVTGVYNSRFKLRYTTEALGVENPDADQTFAFINNNQLHIQSNDAIQEVTLFDLTGKLLKTYKPNELTNQFVTEFFYANGAYIAKIKLENGSVVGRKLLH